VLNENKGQNTVFGYKEEATADMCVKNSVLFKRRKITDVINIRRSAVEKLSSIYELATVSLK
jgi:hypothetical protein